MNVCVAFDWNAFFAGVGATYVVCLIVFWIVAWGMDNRDPDDSAANIVEFPVREPAVIVLPDLTSYE